MHNRDGLIFYLMDSQDNTISISPMSLDLWMGWYLFYLA